MSYAKTLLPVTFIKQTLFPISKNLRYINQGSIDRGIIKFKPTAEELKARITRYCKPNYTRIIRSTTAIKDAIVPVRFCPEPSMHHASCTDFSKTRLHSLPITKSPENPGTCIAPWRPFLGSFRWMTTTMSESNSSSKLATPAVTEPGKGIKLNEMRRRLRERIKLPSNTPRSGRCKRKS
ncbi:unnamed protein product [Chrysodeixis includens]|uniref:Uncharacterized protein n=1 Tax=Chrysodeixis includens TaxID=689277 RepID=A0A9P0BSQ5_CHRIL|nr:unnamed protein product [Chrysodeixis includens]